MATVGFNPGVFNVTYMNNSSGSWNEKIGYVHANILDSASSDTAAVASDLLNFADSLLNVIAGGTMLTTAEVTYTASLQYD